MAAGNISSFSSSTSPQFAQGNVSGAATNGAPGASKPLYLPRAQTNEERQARASQSHGYPAFAEWMASSNDFFVLRKYSRECARCLLRLQHEIAKVSEKLDILDEYSRQQPPGYGGCGSLGNDPLGGDPVENDPLDPPKGRVKLIEEMELLLQRYYDLTNAFTKVHRSETAQEHHVRKLKDWFVNHPGAIDPGEQHLRDESKQNDLFPIVLEYRSPLRMVLRGLRSSMFSLTQWHCARDSHSQLVWEPSEWLTNMVILFVGLLFLVGPMWAMYFTQPGKVQLGIATAFLALFTSLAIFYASQKPFEILAATAAYAAVMMVFG